VQTIIIGAGISGLTCAWRLRQRGVAVQVFEQAERPGGVIQSIEIDGFLFDLGPQSVLANAALLDLVSEAGLEEEFLRADRRAPRYVLVHGRLERVPMAPPALLTTSLLSAGTKWRLLTEPIRKSAPPDGDESVASFVRRKFGGELLERLVAPFVSGVYAGDPEKLSLRAAFPQVHQWENEYGSVIRGAMKSRPAKDAPRPALCSFRAGMTALPRHLARSLGAHLRLGCRVVSIAPQQSDSGKRFRVDTMENGRAESHTADAVLMACGPHAAAPMLQPISTQIANLLEGIVYAPVVVVSAGYRREQVGHPLEGFGFLVPRSEGLRVLGTVWSSSLFPGRAPAGMVGVASFLGGATDPAIFDLGDRDIFEIAGREVANVLKISGSPVSQILQRHSRALPQYNLGHSQRLLEIRNALERWPGLFLAGNYLEGPSVANCVEQALRTAGAVEEFLAQPVHARL